MCVTDLDLEIAAEEQEQAPRRGQHGIGGRYAGVAWGLAERHDDLDDQDAAGPAAAAAAAGPAAAGPAAAAPAEAAAAEAGAAEAGAAEAGAGATRSR